MNQNPIELRDEVVVEPRPYRIDPPLHDPAIFCPVGVLTGLAARIYNARKKLRPLTPAAVYTLKHGKRKLSLVGPAMGAPSAVFVLERMIAHGVSKVIMLGLCGALSPEVKIGDLVVARSARIDEGVSGHYVEGLRISRPSEPAVSALLAVLTDAGKSFHLGEVWTTDAVFRETVSKVKTFQAERVLAVDMETSALFTIAAYRRIDLAALLVVSDELSSLRWRQGFTRPRFLSACRHACHLALAAASALAGENMSLQPLAPEESENGES